MKLANYIKKDCKNIFSHVNNNKKFSSKVGPLKNPNDGIIISDDKQMTNVMVKYFSSVFNKESTYTFPKSKVHFIVKIINCLRQNNINEKLVLDNLQNLKINKSSGPDGLHPKLLYKFRFLIASSLTKLFILSLLAELVPKH